MVNRSASSAFSVPKDLLAAAKRAARPKGDLQVEGWRRTWLSRLSELLIGKD